MRKEIPQWNWYNTQLLFAFDEALNDTSKSAMTIKNFFTEFKQSYGLEDFNYSLKNQGVVLSSLYTLLVVPREIWEKDKVSGTKFQFTTKNKFNIIIPLKDLDNWDFLRLMRNAVSHANFDIDMSNAKYTFWNCPMKAKDCSRDSDEIDFKVEISHENLGKFLTEIGKYYINIVAKNSK